MMMMPVAYPKSSTMVVRLQRAGGDPRVAVIPDRSGSSAGLLDAIQRMAMASAAEMSSSAAQDSRKAPDSIPRP